MSWVKLDDCFPDHPKIARLSAGAFRLHVSGLCYSARLLTDGRIPDEIALRLGPRKFAVELTGHGLWTQDTEGYLIHDYLHYNPSRSQVAASRATNTERVKRWRNGKSNADVTPLQDECNADVTPLVTVPPARPLPVPQEQGQNRIEHADPYLAEKLGPLEQKDRSAVNRLIKQYSLEAVREEVGYAIVADADNVLAYATTLLKQRQPEGVAT